MTVNGFVLGEIAELHRAASTSFDVEHALRVGHLRGLDAQLERGRRLALVDHLQRGEMAHAARADRAARAAGVVAHACVCCFSGAHCTIRTCSSGTSSAFATIWAKVVSWPWPCALDTVWTVTAPSAATSISTSSLGALPAPVFSMTVAMPMPRSLPVFSVCARRFGVAFPVGELQRLVEHARQVRVFVGASRSASCTETRRAE